MYVSVGPWSHYGKARSELRERGIGVKSISRVLCTDIASRDKTRYTIAAKNSSTLTFEGVRSAEVISRDSDTVESERKTIISNQRASLNEHCDFNVS